MSTVSFMMGDFPTARDHAEHGRVLYSPEQHRSLAFIYGADPGLVCDLYDALSLFMLGYYERAQNKMSQASATVHDLSHAHTEAFTLCYESWHYQCRREVQAALAKAEAALAVASNLGIHQWLTWAKMLRGWALAMEGQWEEGVGELREGLRDWRAINPVSEYANGSLILF